LFTRTVGFWKHHPVLTQTVVTTAGDLTVCGEPITNVAIDDAHSALEAMCVSIGGDQRLQLARQLMAASLNVAAGGAPFPPLASCNAVCADPNATATDINTCEGQADTYNGSGDNVPLPFPEGSADPGPCKEAQNTACTITDPGEGSCAVQ
jgi:hypothetical protein